MRDVANDDRELPSRRALAMVVVRRRFVHFPPSGVFHHGHVQSNCRKRGLVLGQSLDRVHRRGVDILDRVLAPIFLLAHWATIYPLDIVGWIGWGVGFTIDPIRRYGHRRRIFQSLHPSSEEEQSQAREGGHLPLLATPELRRLLLLVHFHPTDAWQLCPRNHVCWC